MGFWSSFFGVGAAHVMRDMEQDNKDTQKWNDLFHELGEYETRFQNYLESIGCPGVYIADVEYVNNGNIMPEIRKMDNLRKKVEEYISIGGDARILHDIDNIDEYIDKVKYLRSIGELERQYEFRDNNIYYIQNKISAEKEELEKQQEILRQQELEMRHNQISEMLGTDINNLSGVEFENVCQQLVEYIGFDTETTKASGDGGIDLIAYNHQPLLSGKYIIQCKRYSGSVGEPIIRDLYGVVTSERANKGILMTTGYFTKSAISFAEGKPIELIDGIAMQNLFSQYGINVFGGNSQVRKEYVDVTNGRNIEEVIQDSFYLEDKYDEFLNFKDVVDNTEEEKEIAEYINWLIDKIDSDNFVIFDHSERLVFFKEINAYIKKYLEMRKTEKSELLSYLYQMIYVQNSILLERFTDAKRMFIKMMKNEKIQFNLKETLGETHKTAEVFENTGVFSFLFATWCNMNQLAFFSHDDNLRMYLSDHNLFFGIPSIQDSRIDNNLQLIESGKSNLNPVYFQKQRQLINELNSILNEVGMRIFFKIDNIEVIESFYDYSYFNGKTKDIILEFSDYKVENDEVIINNYGNINLNNALGSYIPFSQNDLLD